MAEPGGAHEISTLERATMARVMRRLLPMLILCYFVAYLDRVNIGFAGPTMNKDLGFSFAIALGPIMSAIVVLCLGHDRRLEHIPARARTAH